MQAGDEALQRGDVELVGPGPAQRQLDVQPPRRGLRRDRVERGDEAVGLSGALLAVDVRAGVCQPAVTSTVGRRDTAAGPVRNVTTARVTGVDVQGQGRLRRTLLSRRVARPVQLTADTWICSVRQPAVDTDYPEERIRRVGTRALRIGGVITRAR